ncbi:MAG: hypothetical protein HETSPECPRED_007469 [Heterodermia speciosa]|uniref:SnoaL-like domain-containing protein n=1 Tax=Heterodermia speciosa TaxID=116794 RepID=A0A8H3IJ22_9LECA|nr:MAG: hypothetical protein HETSPECPRED_007469 [Heterodermia speciosa]
MSCLRTMQAISFIVILFYINGILCLAQDDPTAPIPLPAVATSYSRSLTRQDADIQDQIRNTLAHYPLALDGKNFAALDLFYTADAVANYSEPLNVVTGLPQIEAVVERTLRRVLTQHTYGTQVIEIEKGKTRARSLTYFTATHLGKGNATGKAYYAYGQYQDNLVRIGDGWRVKHRNLVYMGPGIGDASIFSE